MEWRKQVLFVILGREAMESELDWPVFIDIALKNKFLFFEPSNEIMQLV